MGVGKLIDGKATAAEIRGEIASEVRSMSERGDRPPHLAAVLVGNDGGSEAYVSYKVKDCQEVGFASTLIRRPDDVSEEDLLALVDELNANPEIDGFIVQLPLPKHIDAQKVTTRINPAKDVDGFHPQNIGAMTLGLPGFVPATPLGILELLKRNGIRTEGKHCVVLGRSNIVGTPLSVLLSRNSDRGNATVTLCHSRSAEVKTICRQADILIAAMGRPYSMDSDYVKAGAVVIDVGTTRVSNPLKKSGYSLKGDVNFESVAPICQAITPVPGGVGPMTRVALLLNTLKAAKHRS